MSKLYCRGKAYRVHDRCFVNSSNVIASVVACILECIASYSFRCIVGDELDGLYDASDNLYHPKSRSVEQRTQTTYFVLNARVLSLGIFTNQNRIHIIVRCLEAFNRPTRPDVGEKVKGSSKSQVERDVSLSNWCC